MNIIFISAVLLQVSFCYAFPASNGVASFAYQDSTGNRYGGTYDLKDKLTPNSDLFTEPYNDFNSFYPDYFRNYDYMLQQIFGLDYESQRLASYAARKAYELTYNQWPVEKNFGYNPTFSRFPNFGGFPFFGQEIFPNMDGSHQAAFASAAVGPGFSHQIAAIDPINIGMPNVDVTRRFNDVDTNGKPKFYSVSSSSFASSSNDNGKLNGFRGSETVVNNNGKITKYKVQN